MSLSSDQRATLALWFVVNASLGSYSKLVAHFGDPLAALKASVPTWQALGIHKAHLARLDDKPSARAFVRMVEEAIGREVYGVSFELPQMLKDLYDPPPLLFYKGDIKKITQKSLAIVGTRQPSDYATATTLAIAKFLAQQGVIVVSGLATGVDRAAHEGALAQDTHKGATVGVMGTGIDICYPKQHQGLVFDIIDQGGCLISELLPGTPASKYTFPRRNRLVVGLSAATIVTEAKLPSGSLLSARLATEQGKQVFALPGRIDEPNSEGCHHLIREGATLIYHPQQVLDELNPTYIKPLTKADMSDATFCIQQAPSQTAPDIPAHLTPLYNILQNEGQDLDKLVATTGLDIGQLLAQLTELEILGLAVGQGGRYAKA